MTPDDNGEDRGALAGWVIVIVHGKTLLGRFVHGSKGDVLSPVYELLTAMQVMQAHPQQAPQIIMIRQAQPLLTFSGLKSIPMPEGGIVIGIDFLSHKERRELAKSVDACEQLLGSMRAQDSGIVIPPAGSRVKLP